MSDSEFEIVKAIPNPVLRRLVRVKGVEFEEAFIADLIWGNANSETRHASYSAEICRIFSKVLPKNQQHLFFGYFR